MSAFLSGVKFRLDLSIADTIDTWCFLLFLDEGLDLTVFSSFVDFVIPVALFVLSLVTINEGSLSLSMFI